MGISRRNAIIGIGTLAAGAGVIGASGAFTSVEADRTISVSSTGDGSANVQIVVNEVEGLVDPEVAVDRERGVPAGLVLDRWVEPNQEQALDAPAGLAHPLG
jgi:hypothetical protein